MLETYAHLVVVAVWVFVEVAITTQNGYSPPGVPGSGELAALPGRRSSYPGFSVARVLTVAQLPKPPVNTVIESL